MKASFFKRLAAYFIDIMFVSLVVSVISFGFSSTKYEEANSKYNDLIEKYTLQEITTEEYTKSLGPIMYDMQKSSVVVSTITVTLSIAYFIVFQYLNKGQTLGKKLLGLRVLENDKEPSLKSIILRTFIIDSIFSGLLGIILLYILNKQNYYIVYYIIIIIELIFVCTSSLFILYRKDKKGLHDLLAHTEVIDEKR